MFKNQATIVLASGSPSHKRHPVPLSSAEANVPSHKPPDYKSFHTCSFALLLRQISFCISVEYKKNTLSHTKLVFLAGEQNIYL